MAVEETLENSATGAEPNPSQEQGSEVSSTEGAETKTYTQEEVDNMMARMRKSVEHKAVKPYEDLGSPEELRELKQQAEARQQEEQLNRGEFEKTLQDMAAKKDAEIQKRDAQIREFKLNTPLLNAAARHNSVNPEQVQNLLQNRLTLGDNGEAVAVDGEGNTLYGDDGKAKGVDTLVSEFLSENPHFVKPSAGTANTQGNTGVSMQRDVDVSQLDLKNPEHRKIYAEMRKKK